MSESLTQNPFIAALVRDLSAFSPELIDAGGAPVALVGQDHSDGLAGILRLTRQFGAMLPALLREIEADVHDGSWEEQRSRIPAHARLSPSPSDWTRAGARILPVYWRRMCPTERPGVGSLRWLQHLIETLARRTEEARDQNEKRLADARAPESSQLPFNAECIDALMKRSDRLRLANGALALARAELRVAAGAPVLASELQPHPFPTELTWRALRRLVPEILDPLSTLKAGISVMLSSRVAVADVPWLYQRWCGLQLLRSISRLGATLHGDAVRALYAGGMMEFVMEDTTLSLFIEPRLTRNGVHPSGYYACRGQEASPDFLIVTPGPEGTDAFCLDATLSGSDETMRSKFRYLDLLASQRTMLIAGVPTRKPPLRSWAMAPLVRDRCELRGADGSQGMIPANPLHWSSAPLDAWLADILRHATVWAKVVKREATRGGAA